MITKRRIFVAYAEASLRGKITAGFVEGEVTARKLRQATQLAETANDLNPLDALLVDREMFTFAADRFEPLKEVTSGWGTAGPVVVLVTHDQDLDGLAALEAGAMLLVPANYSEALVRIPVGMMLGRFGRQAALTRKALGAGLVRWLVPIVISAGVSMAVMLLSTGAHLLAGRAGDWGVDVVVEDSSDKWGRGHLVIENRTWHPVGPFRVVSVSKGVFAGLAPSQPLGSAPSHGILSVPFGVLLDSTGTCGDTIRLEVEGPGRNPQKKTAWVDVGHVRQCAQSSGGLPAVAGATAVGP